MTSIEGEYLCVECEIPNCTKKRLSRDTSIYYSAPNGKDTHGNPVQVKNCTITPQRVSVSGGKVFDCESFNPMDAA